MKSVSVTNLKDLKIAPQDRNAVGAQLALMKSATAIVASLNNIKNTIDKIEIPEHDITPLLNKHYELIAQLIGQIQSETITHWEFDLKRNNRGFLDKVIADGR